MVIEPHCPQSSTPPPPAPSSSSPPCQTPQLSSPSLRRSASLPHASTSIIATAAALTACQTDRGSIVMHSHLPPQGSACSPTSCPPTVQTTEAEPPEEPKASPKAPHRTHTAPPNSIAHHTTTFLGCNSGISYTYTPAASSTIILNFLFMLYAYDADSFEAVNAKVSETSF
ncbi:uncharacterized protein MONOS_6403 [Monocercomonoides exilis]|uniref:uncharacterized protein n=1 Tax=Monocercomonoides exilis TaxID=2049356 RepID=UPI003559E76F|nr:hypothetical protein MONOS_6403 [Monocercomonoides exilis]|eukprot:MONOS_6403.1-p1 / transcript=MONOS_6403.1 / gene=MONOS_6403 / organism=Monocercomonoides_exilis_PA203 / gene_product=unspecified product / transcript_product=unspecified product / location=Mono_scaffold00201:47709-48221(+) / protein_length=171 / sequence_SO=supercontig / SO=protein_coding / is_pseudo=false